MSSFNFFYLAHRFKDKQVTEKTQANYLIAMAVLGCVIGAISNLSGYTNSTESLLPWQLWTATGFGILLSLLPLFAFLNGNTAGDGKEPVARYTLMLFDASIRYALTFVVLGIGAGIVLGITIAILSANGGLMAMQPTDSTTAGFWVGMFGIALYTAVLTWHMHKSGRIASGAQK